MRAAALLCCLALPACVAGEAVMQETTRGLARTAVNAAAERYVPGVNVAPFTDCVINNAQTSELIQLARYASAGADGAAEAWPVVRGVVQRPEASQCLVSQISGSQILSLGGLAL